MYRFIPYLDWREIKTLRPTAPTDSNDVSSVVGSTEEVLRAAGLLLTTPSGCPHMPSTLSREPEDPTQLILSLCYQVLVTAAAVLRKAHAITPLIPRLGDRDELTVLTSPRQKSPSFGKTSIAPHINQPTSTVHRGVAKVSFYFSFLQFLKALSLQYNRQRRLKSTVLQNGDLKGNIICGLNEDGVERWR